MHLYAAGAVWEKDGINQVGLVCSGVAIGTNVLTDLLFKESEPDVFLPVLDEVQQR